MEQKSYLETFLTMRGTLGPACYWLRVIPTVIVATVLCFCIWVYLSSIGAGTSHPGVFIPVAFFLMIIVAGFTLGSLLAQAIRRLRDAQARPLWSVLLFVPGLNLPALIIFGLLPRRAADKT